MAQIVVGQTVGVTGSAAITVKESMQGASLYLDFVNAQGGVGGQKIELVVLDESANRCTVEPLSASRVNVRMNR